MNTFCCHDRIERVKKYERLYDAAKTQPDAETIAALSAYYSSGEWLEDYEADERGEFPPDLMRGVLSQDVLFKLLEEQKEVELLYPTEPVKNEDKVF